MKVSEESFWPKDAQAETLPKQFISSEVYDIFNALKAYIIAGQTSRPEDQEEAVRALSDGVKDYETKFKREKDVAEAVRQIAADGLAIDWAMQMIVDGNLDFDLSDAEPLLTTEKKGLFKRKVESEVSLTTAVTLRQEEILTRLETMTALTRDQILSGNHSIEPSAIIAAVTHMKSSPVENLRIFSGVMVEIDLPLPENEEEAAELLSQAA